MESPVVTATAGLLRWRVHTEVHTCCGQVGLKLPQEPRSTDAEGGGYAKFSSQVLQASRPRERTYQRQSPTL